MAMNLRLPPTIDDELDAIAAEDHVSKSALLIQGAELLIARRNRQQRIATATRAVLSDDAKLLDRLADA